MRRNSNIGDNKISYLHCRRWMVVGSHGSVVCNDSRNDSAAELSPSGRSYFLKFFDTLGVVMDFNLFLVTIFL